MHCPSFLVHNNIWVSLIVGGIANGFLYALLALGYTLVYGVLRLINFAHSEVMMSGGFGGLFAMRAVLGSSSPGGFWAIWSMLIGIVAGACAGGAAAFLLERVAYRPLRKRNAPRLTYLISAIGASYFLFNLAGKEFGRYTAFIPTPTVVSGDSFYLCGVGVQSDWVLTMVVAVILLVVLDLVVGRTKLGMGIRAVAQDAETASLMGVHIDRTISLTFVLGGLMGGVAGFLFGVQFGVIYTMGFVPGLKAFTAAVLGGIGNIRGAMVGGLLLGIFESIPLRWMSAEWQDVVAFGVLVTLLLFRPTGLLGERLGREA
ncbi:MAG TPA: branched-chain amino acid ABC transporter permease [Acidimicrobiales bacterium]|nr:branched-chain amino acid ABC transporter permease [Acidimicrobiales bacterium]